VRRFFKALGLLVSTIAGIGVYMTQVGPDDAASNLSRWWAKFAPVPDWLEQPAADNWGTGFFAIILVVGLLPLIWPALTLERHQERRSSTLTVRNAFSQTQSIKNLPPSLGGNSILKLDNVATLKLHNPYSMSSVTLLLDVVPIDISIQHGPGMSIEGAKRSSLSGTVQYVFDVEQHKRREIAVAGRTFIVTLLEVKKLSMANVSNAIEWVFGISEK